MLDISASFPHAEVGNTQKNIFCLITEILLVCGISTRYGICKIISNFGKVAVEKNFNYFWFNQ